MRYGNPEVSDDQNIRTAKVAGIHDFIISFPNGYDAPVSERGVNLSEGQKQRLSIAHRLSTIQNSDRILLLNEKRLVAIGTHQELLKNSAYYRTLVANQEIIS